MKFNEIVKTNSWLSVQLTLISLYPDQAELKDEYRKVFEELLASEAIESEFEIVLTVYDCDPDFDPNKETYVDVSGRKNIPDPNSMTESYALEFVQWNKWLGMDISPETMRCFSELEIISHCLHEMTFIGFDEDDIQEQFKSIENTVDEYNNLTEEEKISQTISIEELMKKLDDKEGKC